MECVFLILFSLLCFFHIKHRLHVSDTVLIFKSNALFTIPTGFQVGHSDTICHMFTIITVLHSLQHRWFPLQLFWWWSDICTGERIHIWQALCFQVWCLQVCGRWHNWCVPDMWPVPLSPWWSCIWQVQATSKYMKTAVSVRSQWLYVNCCKYKYNL